MLTAVRLGRATSLISARVILDSLASMVRTGHLRKKASTQRKDAWGPYPAA